MGMHLHLCRKGFGAVTLCYICLLIDLHDREIVGHAASRSKDAALVMAAFATVAFPFHDIDVFHTDYAAEIAKPHSITLSLVGTLKTPSFAA